ncbi:unnamed protein product [Vitrella brassicaformis CCMP3155]|uniref:Uncharacterized protein n=1 Tax=Vitrella brassicaformis (strain CCMP3155) TaxID=1169540 RepID=A0A0G4FXN1_VITBC|nr:unnamed protein product [Vitrella brassicaformis CCMP3155]|eukprot:CEM19621.1 unnamed protein product [Vitrella brassicaformis CCMP3155]
MIFSSLTSDLTVDCQVSSRLSVLREGRHRAVSIGQLAASEKALEFMAAMEERDRQVKRSRPGDGGSGVESDEERQRRAERERLFWENAPPGLMSIPMAFLPIHLLMQLQLPPLIRQHAVRKQHHLTIS